MRFANNRLLAPRHWSTIVEAGLALAVASAATFLLPFNRYIGLGAKKLGRAGGADGMAAAQIVDAIADRVPFRALCLQRGLACQWMLRRRGEEAILHYGIKLPGQSKEIAAHVWVSVADTVRLGAPQHEQYAEVARFPTASKQDAR